MTEDRKLAAARSMCNGGGFAAAIADAWFKGDSHNQPRVYEAFKDLFEKFAPPQGEAMKTFEVEIRRTSFITVTVEAGDTEEAVGLAWQEIPDTKEASWAIESVEEKK